MKINGKSLTIKNQTVLVLKRGEEEFPLTISPLPAGWSEMCRVRGLLSFPNPPKKAVEVKGKIERDPVTKRAVYEDDTNDPAYRETLAKISLRYDVICLAEHLRNDSTVQFDAKRPDTDDPKAWAEYGNALCLEVCDPDCGFTDKEIEEITRQGSKLECRFDIQAATDAFLPENQ